MITRITQLVCLPKGEPIFSERATTITIQDEAAGEFFTLTQHIEGEDGEIRIDTEEWPAIQKAINTIVKEIRDNENPPKG